MDRTFSSALIIFAHPDDGEYTCGGTVAAWTAAGTEVHYVVITDGSAGSNEPGVTRAELRESANASSVRRRTCSGSSP